MDSKPLFKKMASEPSEKISAESLKSLINDLNEHYSDNEIKVMISELDSDNDGLVSYEDFIKILEPNKLIK